MKLSKGGTHYRLEKNGSSETISSVNAALHWKIEKIIAVQFRPCGQGVHDRSEDKEESSHNGA